MDFQLSEEQRMIKEMARATVAREIEPVSAAHPADQPLPKEALLTIYTSLKKLGVLAPRLPEEAGGSGLPYLTYGMIMEELPAWLGVGTQAHEVTLTRIYQGGTEEQKRKFLPDLIDGKKIACSGISEPNVGSDPRAIETTAVRDGEEVAINGTKLWITNGSVSDVILAVCSLGRDDAGRNLTTRVVVEREVSPYEAREVAAVGMRQGHLSEVVFQDCRVPPENVLGDPGDAHQNLTLSWLANRPILGMLAVGLAQKGLDSCVAYAGTRKQFGRYIGGFQLVQEMLSEMATRIEASRLLCLRALAMLDEGVRSNKEASMAKWFATENCLTALKLGMQIHGAMGLTEELGMERLFRDAFMLTIPDGTTQIQHLIIGQELTGIRAYRG